MGVGCRGRRVVPLFARHQLDHLTGLNIPFDRSVRLFVTESCLCFRRLDDAHPRRLAARSDDLRLAVAIHVIEPRRSSVQPWLTARLRPSIDAGQMQNLVGRHALDRVVVHFLAPHVSAVTAPEVVRDRPVELVHLDAEAHMIAVCQPERIRDEVIRQAFRFDQFERERKLLRAKCAVMLTNKDLAGIEYLRHQSPLEAAERQTATGVTVGRFRPFFPNRFDIVVHAYI